MRPQAEEIAPAWPSNPTIVATEAAAESGDAFSEWFVWPTCEGRLPGSLESFMDRRKSTTDRVTTEARRTTRRKLRLTKETLKELSGPGTGSTDGHDAGVTAKCVTFNGAAVRGPDAA